MQMKSLVFSFVLFKSHNWFLGKLSGGAYDGLCSEEGKNMSSRKTSTLTDFKTPKEGQKNIMVNYCKLIIFFESR